MAQKDYELLTARLNSFEKNLSEKTDSLIKSINDKIDMLFEKLGHYDKESSRTREELIRADEKFKSLEKDNISCHTILKEEINLHEQENKKYSQGIHARVVSLEKEAERYKYKIILIVIAAGISGLIGGFLKAWILP